MDIKIKYNPKMVPKGYSAITLYPYIFVSKEKYLDSEVLINHERIHIEQQKELLIIFFYLLYGFEWLIRLIIFKDKHVAYRTLSFEHEAYTHEHDLNYLKHRNRFNFRFYIKK